MFSRVKRIVFFGCAVLIVLLLAIYLDLERRESEELVFVSETELSALLQNKSEATLRLSSGRLTILGLPAPYDETENIFYLPQSAEGAFNGRAFRWSDPDCRVYAALKEGATKADLIRSGEALTTAVVCGDTYLKTRLVLTGTAMLSIKTEQEVSYAFDKGLPAGNLYLFTPDAQAEGGVSAVSALCTHRLRGQLSRKLQKVSYRIALFDRHGQRAPAGLVGMGMSDEWILNAMYSEPNRMRDKLSLDLWNSIASTNPASDPPGSEAAYTELMLDGTYMGLYLLIRPTDESSLGLSGQDVLFKASSWTVPKSADVWKHAHTLGSEETGVFIKWPKDGVDVSAWTHMVRYLFCFYDENGEAADGGRALLERGNLIDYALFYRTVAAADNYFANTYYLVEDGIHGDGVIKKIPWDLNYTFGNVFTSLNDEKFRLRYEEGGTADFPPDTQRLLAIDGDGALLSAIATRYLALRETVLSDASMLQKAEALSDEITESGAISREAARWPEGRVEESANDLYAYIRTHMAALDAEILPNAAQKKGE